MARNKFDVDEDLSQEFNAHSVRRMFAYLAAHRAQVLLAVGLMVVASLASLIPPYLIRTAIDETIPNHDVTGILILGAIILISQAIGAVCLRFRIIIMSRMGQNVVHAIRSDVFARLNLLGFQYYDSRPHGKILIRVVNYVNSLSDLLSNGIINLITDVFSLIFIIAFMFAIDTRLTFICLAGLPVLFVLVLLLKKFQRKTWQDMSRKQSNLNAYLHESLSGARISQSFAREAVNEDIFRSLGTLWRKSWIKAVMALFSLWPGIEIISVIGVCAIYIAGVSWLDQGMTVGVLVAFVGYVWRFWAPITTIGNFYSALIQSAAYLERIFETMDEKLDDPEDEKRPELPAVKGDVHFESVSFAYEAGQPILKNINFNARPGSTTAIVGPTGAGKTTMVNLLSRFYSPQVGRILIDDYDISKYRLASIRKQMGVMLQDSFLFSGTVMDNIRYGRLDATDAEVEAAARAVHVHDYISQLPEGYQTPVHERGVRLSMGQRQLISFARALLANPTILILDEATSSVDTETERAIQKGLKSLLANRTSFVIAHRLSTIRNADTIFFVEHGEILEQGTHDELVARGGKYKELYAHVTAD